MAVGDKWQLAVGDATRSLEMYHQNAGQRTLWSSYLFLRLYLLLCFSLSAH